MGDILNNLTNCQLSDLKNNAAIKRDIRKDIPCAYCRVTIPRAITTQRFCSTRCRVRSSQAELRREYERLQDAEDNYLAEIARLRALLLSKGFSPD